MSSIQKNLRKYLSGHESYSIIYKDSFLSGSYAKHTAIRPVKGENKRDVDIIVVTSHSQNDDSTDVINELYDVLRESDTYKNVRIQHHSVSVDMSQVSVDIVPVVMDDYDDELYWVADSKTGEWVKTDPKGHKLWATEVNQDNNNEYKPLVKIFKWWRRVNCPANIRYPKGITLEKIVADHLGDSSASTEEFLIGTMQNVVSAFKENYVDIGINPYIDDPSNKITNNDLLSGYSTEDFGQFIIKLEENLALLSEQGAENDTWRKILGDEFPKDNQSKSLGNIYLCATANHRQKPTWPMARGGAAILTLKVNDSEGNKISYESNGNPLEKSCTLHFNVITGVKPPYTVKWQITNTGEEANRANCLRGDFYDSNEGTNGRYESTAYLGSHSVQCFIIKRGVCVAKSKDFIVNIK